MPLPDVAPRESREFTLPLPASRQFDASEFFLNVFITTNNPDPLIPVGHVVAEHQLKLPWKPNPGINPVMSASKLSLDQSPEKATVAGEEFTLVFDKKRGLIESYQFHGVPLINNKMGPEPNFWRAPNDNDFGNNMPKRLGRWKKAFDEAKLTNANVTQAKDGTVSMQVLWDFPGKDVKFGLVYQVKADGTVEMQCDFKVTTQNKIPELPRLGLMMGVPKGLKNVAWYGRGPFENYWDRKTAAKVGVYQNTVAAMYEPYVAPQECGYREDARWVSLTNDQGIGWVAKGGPLLNFSALYFTPYDLTREYREEFHTPDMKPNDFVTWCLDYRQTGVGGDTSWGAKTHDKYTVHAQDYAFTITLKPVNKGF